MSYNVSKRESALYGIPRVKVSKGGSSGGSSNGTTKKISDLQEKYLESLKPSSTETDLETQLQNLINSRELGIASVKQEPMPQKFVTGQSAAITEAAALKSMPLETRLSNLQKQRQISSNVLGTSLGYLKEQLASEQAAEQSAWERSMEEKKLAESIREFDMGQSSKKSGSSTSDQDKRDKEFQSKAESLAKDVKNKKMSRESAKEVLKRLFPEYDENVIYDLVPDFWET